MKSQKDRLIEGLAISAIMCVFLSVTIIISFHLKPKEFKIEYKQLTCPTCGKVDAKVTTKRIRDYDENATEHYMTHSCVIVCPKCGRGVGRSGGTTDNTIKGIESLVSGLVKDSEENFQNKDFKNWVYSK